MLADTMKLKLSLLVISAVTIIALIPLRANARATSFDILNFQPVVDGSNFLTVYGSETLGDLNYHGAFHLDYALTPLRRSGGAPGTREGIVDHILTGHFGGAIGLSDWFQAGLNFPVVFYEEFFDPNTANPTGQTKTEFGDLGLFLKLNLVTPDEFPVGFGVVPFLYFPTGTGDVFTGSNSFSGGAKLVVDGEAFDRVSWAANVGFLARDRMTLRNVVANDQFLLSGGLSVRIVDWMHAIGELDTRTVFSNFFADETQSPVELRGGLRFSPAELGGIVLNFGFGGGVVNGIGAPDFRILLGAFYQPSYGKYRGEPVQTVVELREVILEKDRIVILRSIYFKFNKADILPRSYSILDQVAQLLKDHPNIKLVRVEGHTDSIGSVSYNLRLSQARAESVVHYLVEKGGIDKKRLIAKGFGESQPMVPKEASEEDRAQNRRVEFIILKQDPINEKT